MAIYSVKNIRIAGISACVPEKVMRNIDYNWLTIKERKNLIKNVGVEEKRHVKKGTATSDLCYVAADNLIKDLKWDRNDIDLLVFISQSRDYIMPSTSHILQDRLGLSENCASLDVVMGCSAYNYGLSVVSSLMLNGTIKKSLLLIGDISSIGSYRDKTTFPLFGDAGTATAFEYVENYPETWFNLQTNGADYDAIIIPESGYRHQPNENTFNYKKFGKGIWRHGGHVALDGMRVFEFSLREVAPNVKRLLKHAGLSNDDIDYFVFHQANFLMNDTIRKMLKIDPDKFPYSLKKFGNTSSASIPLTIVTELKNQITSKKLTLLFAGFGVGLSWGSNILQTDKIVCPELIEYEKYIEKNGIR
ncbi:MAG: ketoacyl-ACP synthase III [Marinilabiliales bacterium]